MSTPKRLPVPRRLVTCLGRPSNECHSSRQQRRKAALFSLPTVSSIGVTPVSACLLFPAATKVYEAIKASPGPVHRAPQVSSSCLHFGRMGIRVRRYVRNTETWGPCWIVG